MINVAFLHEGKSYMPEISSYVSYLNRTEDIRATVVTDAKLIDNQYDLVWKVMGLDFKRTGDYALIHEYNTITVGKYSSLKDLIKRYANTKPDGRVFQNFDVLKTYHFNDNVPFIYRDMGINAQYYDLPNVEKEYDFVYVGTMDASRELDKMLEAFKHNPDLSIVLIGTPNEALVESYGHLDNVHFEGRVDYEKLPQIANKARYGMNYIPDIYPFNIQTSTKLLEYCAMGLDIVTTDYKWINDFEASHEAQFFKLNSDLSNLTRENLEAFNFQSPDLKNMEWGNHFDEIGLVDFIKTVYEDYLNKKNA